MAHKKGKEFERETAALAGKYGQRVIMSGAIASMDGTPQMAGDVRWKFPWFDSELKVECKHGYDRSKKPQKSMTVYREWFEKHMTQGKALDFYPVFAFKFKFTSEGTGGLSKFVLIPFPVMEKLIHQMENMYLELEELRMERDANN